MASIEEPGASIASSSEASATNQSTGSGGDQGKPTRSSTATVSYKTEIENLKFDALRSAYLNEYREWFFTFINRAIMFLVTFSGTATFATLAQPDSAHGARYIALIVTFLGLIDLVFDLTGSARNHAFLRHKFLELYGDANTSSADAVLLRERLHKLYAEEPATYRVVDAIAYNAAARSLGKPEGNLLVIPWWLRLVAHLVPASTRDFITKDESAALPVGG